MEAMARQELRAYLAEALREAGDAAALADGDSLFVSGRLDSLALTRLVLHLEQRFGLDLGALDFSAELVDSVDAIAALLPLTPARSAAPPAGSGNAPATQAVP